MTSIIEIDRLVKEYQPGRRAIDELSFQVYSGEIFGFLGPNGAGKTSTLKILTTLSKPTSGRATVAGFDVVTEPNKVRAAIGYVGQQSGVDMALTGRENLTLQGQLFHLSKKEVLEQSEELLSLFGLKESADWRVGAYSGGMKRKLDIATSLIQRPKVLFLDEPTLGLDPQSRSALWEYIRRLNRDRGMTIFLTTHYLEEADRLSHRLAIIDAGKIRAIGTSDQLKDTLAGDGIHLTFEEDVHSQDLGVIRQAGMARELIQEGKEVHLYLENGRSVLPKLLQLLDQVKVPIRTVALSRPSLDDVFLKYTGHSLGKGEEGSSGGNPWWPGGGGGDWQKWQKKCQKNGEEPASGESGAEGWKNQEGTAPESGDWSERWKKSPQPSDSSSSTPSASHDQQPAGSWQAPSDQTAASSPQSWPKKESEGGQTWTQSDWEKKEEGKG